jgi:hypothetical protein
MSPRNVSQDHFPYWGETPDRVITVTETGDTFTLEGRDDGELAVVYTYDPRIGWFGGLTYYEDGEVTYVFELVDHGDAFQGSIVSWGLESLGRVQGRAPGDTTTVTFPVPPDSDLVIEFMFDCTEGPAYYMFQYARSTPTPTPDHQQDGGCVTVDETFIIPQPGQSQWTASLHYTASPLATPSGYSIEGWARTLEATPITDPVNKTAPA